MNNFHQWAVAFVVCNFNVDIGPEIEVLYPPDVAFSTSDLSAIAFNSFPERHDSETMEDLVFHFTIANNSPDILLSSPNAPHGSPTNLYGCCIFRQELDHSIKRSFNQRSLVLISTHEFPSLFGYLLKQMTADGMICDPTALESAYSQMRAWPVPSLGTLELPFMGSTITLEIAPHKSFPMQGLPGAVPLLSDKPSSIFAYSPLGSWDTLMTYMPSISDLYILYEKLLLCESIIVLARSPQLCSEAVSSLVDLVRPVPYAGEIKPYMTMQSEFQSIGIDGGTPRPFIIGITNPFLLKRILSATETSAPDRSRPHILYLQNPGTAVPVKRRHSLHHRSGRSTPSTSAFSLLDIPSGIDPLNTPSPAKRFVKSDPALVSQITSVLKVDITSDTLSPLIRRHFAELTAQFVAPLNRYLATTIQTSPSPIQPTVQTTSTSSNGQLSPTTIPSQSTTSRYASFNITDFLSQVAKHGSSFRFRGQGALQRHRARDHAYEAFCRSPNFFSWLEVKCSLEGQAEAGLLGPSTGGG